MPDLVAGGVGGFGRGLSPLDVATQVAVPEFDGRIITVPFSFKETDRRRSAPVRRRPERCARVAAIAAAHARLRHTPAAERKVGLVLSAYPTKHSRIGNAVGLDTPVSAIRLLRAMRDAGYDVGEPAGSRDPRSSPSRARNRTPPPATRSSTRSSRPVVKTRNG